MFEQIGKILKGIGKKRPQFGTSFRRASEEFTLQKNNYGVVGVEVAAIAKVVGRSAGEVAGISDAKVSIDRLQENSPLKLHFALALEQNFSVQDVSRDLVSAVRADLENIFAIIEVEIYVRVTDVQRQEKKPKRRVR